MRRTLLAARIRAATAPNCRLQPPSSRHFSQSAISASSRTSSPQPEAAASKPDALSKPAEIPQAAAISPRWLSDAKQRIGKCIMFGLDEGGVRKAGQLCKALGENWRELVAGSEGYLTAKNRAGLLGHKVVWGEMDSMQHVNNVMYTRYAESARVEWAYNFAKYIDPDNSKEWTDLWTPRGIGMILRSIRTDYKFPMVWPDKVSIFHKLRSAPTPSSDSFILDVMILSERQQRPAARCVEDIVVYDYKNGRKTPMPPFMLTAFGETYKLQEEARKINTKKVEALLADLQALEKASWDRSDAKEDFGGP